jgi:hypothetical protein
MKKKMENSLLSVKLMTTKTPRGSKFTKTFQEGILAGMESFSAAVLSYGLTHDQVRGYALKVWDVLISGNNKSLTDAFNNLNHNETFGLGGYVKRAMYLQPVRY